MINNKDFLLKIEIYNRKTNKLSSISNTFGNISDFTPIDYMSAYNFFKYIDLHRKIYGIVKPYMVKEDNVFILCCDREKNVVFSKSVPYNTLPTNQLFFNNLDVYDAILEKINIEDLLFYLTYTINI